MRILSGLQQFSNRLIQRRECLLHCHHPACQAVARLVELIHVTLLHVQSLESVSQEQPAWNIPAVWMESVEIPRIRITGP